jgi:Flp pilus assembly protein TadD
LQAQPNEPDLLYDQAMIAERLNKIDVLEANLARVIEIKPDNAHAYNALGYSLADRNVRLDEARKLIAKALSLAPDDPFILDSMGWVLFRLGQADEALKHLERAYAQRKDPEIAAHLGEVLWSIGRRDDARKVWLEAKSRDPGNEVLGAVLKKFLP